MKIVLTNESYQLRFEELDRSIVITRQSRLKKALDDSQRRVEMKKRLEKIPLMPGEER